jgi:hypothetical protein
VSWVTPANFFWVSVAGPLVVRIILLLERKTLANASKFQNPSLSQYDHEDEGLRSTILHRKQLLRDLISQISASEVGAYPRVKVLLLQESVVALVLDHLVRDFTVALK